MTAARALGAGTNRILFRHVLPNAVAPTIVVATISLGGYISAEATLSYLGLGLGRPDDLVGHRHRVGQCRRSVTTRICCSSRPAC